jgi:hypothetical protein
LLNAPAFGFDAAARGRTGDIPGAIGLPRRCQLHARREPDRLAAIIDRLTLLTATRSRNGTRSSTGSIRAQTPSFVCTGG